MKAPIDPRRAEETGQAASSEPEAKAPGQKTSGQAAPPQDAVEAAVARFLDSILPESRASRRTAKPQRIRRAS